MITHKMRFCLLFITALAMGQSRVIAQGGQGHLPTPIASYITDPETGIVDYSYAGYRANEQVLPEVPVRVVVPPVEGDNAVRIQAALDYIGRLAPDEQGVRGAVLLQPGDYDISSQLRIHVSGVVLRGAGTGINGTRLIATGQDRRALIRVVGQSDKTLGQSYVINEFVAVGSRVVTLSETGGLDVGDRIMITRPSTEEWVVAVGMSKFWQAKKAPHRWKAGELDLTWDRRIESIEGNQVTLDAPLTMALDPDWGGGTLSTYTWPGRVSQVGIENLQLVSDYDRTRDMDEDHAWLGITMEHARDAWIRGVTFRHFAGGAVALWESTSRVTVVDCVSLEPVSENGGWRRHTFFTTGQQILFLRCYSEDGRHDFCVGHCAAGPNAFVHCDARRALDDSGSIGSWATGVLYDNVNIDGAGLRLGYRATEMQFIGWNAVHSLMWQCTGGQLDCYRPPMAQNWAIGCWGDFSGDGHWSKFNEFVNPRSLMQALVSQRCSGAAGDFIGVGVVHPSGGGGRGGRMMGPMGGGGSSGGDSLNRPAPQLTEVIAASRQGYGLDLEGSHGTSIDTILEQHPDLIPPQSQPAAQALRLVDGQLKVGDKLLTGKTHDTYWWRGRRVPQSIEFKRSKPELTRFMPGRIGQGWTDDLESLTTSLSREGYAAVYQHPGLWYDRRREDHERVRRPDGEVWAPFDELPFLRSGQGTAWDGLSRYDLTRYNPWYFDRLEAFAQQAEHKGLVLLNNHYFQHNILKAGAHWADSPWRPANNINDTGFPEPPPYYQDKYISMAHLFYDVSHPGRRALYQAYIRHHLERLSECPNVIHMTSAEYSGPLSFTQFWLDTIGQWEKETGKDVLTALSCTYDVQEAILNDPARAAIVDIIDIRYWQPRSDGTGHGPRGGINVAPRKQGWYSVKEDRPSLEAAAARYRERFPDKAIICSGMGFQVE